MHTALLIDEIVALVAAHVLGPQPSACAPRRRPDTASVLAFALSRRAFLEPALNTLWRELLSLEPLLALLSSPEHSTRFEHYARRVRHLTCDDPHDVDTLADTLLSYPNLGPHAPLLALSCVPQSPSASSMGQSVRPRTCSPGAGAGSLLPRLLSMHGTTSSTRGLEALCALIPPTLRHLYVHALMPWTFDVEATSEPSRQQGVRTLSALRDLQTLTLDLPFPPTLRLMSALGTLPNLNHLCLMLAPGLQEPEQARSVTGDTRDDGPFPVLRTLTASGSHASHVDLLRTLPTLPVLETAELVLVDACPFDSSRILEGLLKRRAPSLRELDVRGPTAEEEAYDEDSAVETDDDALRASMENLHEMLGHGNALTVY